MGRFGSRMGLVLVEHHGGQYAPLHDTSDGGAEGRGGAGVREQGQARGHQVRVLGVAEELRLGLHPVEHDPQHLGGGVELGGVDTWQVLPN